MKPLAELGPADFRPFVGQRFTVVQNEGDLSLELLEVKPLPPHTHRDAPFALLFRGPRHPQLTQRVYTLAHRETGTLAIFLVPVKADAEGIAYEAVFN